MNQAKQPDRQHDPGSPGSPGQGQPTALAEVVPQVYDELRHLAAAYMAKESAGHTLQPTALVHEAYLRLADQTGIHWQDRSHFCALAAGAMRQILVAHALHKKALKRGGDVLRVSFHDEVAAVPALDLDVLALDEALKVLAQLDERKSRVVELRFFGGLTKEETAQALSISAKSVEADWYAARAWLRSRCKEGGW